MQEVEFLLREIGEGAMSSDELKEYISYTYASRGFNLFQENPFPVMKDGKIKSVQVFMVFVKDEEVLFGQSEVGESYVEGGSEETVTDAPKKRGRPAKAS